MGLTTRNTKFTAKPKVQERVNIGKPQAIRNEFASFQFESSHTWLMDCLLCSKEVKRYHAKREGLEQAT